MNRHERRIQQSKQAKLRREISAANYSPIKDPQFVKGIAITVRAVELHGLGGVGRCLFRSLVALQALQGCHVSASLHVGSLLCRIGPDEYRDVVAFRGPGNAGYGQGYHAWVEVDDYILDFSVGDWRGLDAVAHERAQGLPPMAPPQWTIDLPPYWCKPRRELVDPWQPVGTPELGKAWYGPYDDDPFVREAGIRMAIEGVGQQIADAVETVMARAAAQQGLPRPDRNTRPVRVSPIIETRNAPTSAPPGMVEMMASEIFQLAGLNLGTVPDAVAYVSYRPTTREQALEMLANMSMTAPR